MQSVCKKIPLLIKFLAGITLKIQLKGVIFYGHPVLRKFLILFVFYCIFTSATKNRPDHFRECRLHKT